MWELQNCLILAKFWSFQRFIRAPIATFSTLPWAFPIYCAKPFACSSAAFVVTIWKRENSFWLLQSPLPHKDHFNSASTPPRWSWRWRSLAAAWLTLRFHSFVCLRTSSSCAPANVSYWYLVFSNCRSKYSEAHLCSGEYIWKLLSTQLYFRLSLWQEWIFALSSPTKTSGGNRKGSQNHFRSRWSRKCRENEIGWWPAKLGHCGLLSWRTRNQYRNIGAEFCSIETSSSV